MTFKIYPFRKKKDQWDKFCWWTVTIFDNPKALRSEVVNKRCTTCKGDFGGSKDCFGLTHRHGFSQSIDTHGNIKPPKLKGEIGLIFLENGRLGVGVVSHEMCHAMMYTTLSYTHVINFNSNTWGDADEWMAYTLSNLVNCFYVLHEKRYNALAQPR